jgi:hypothetical protein
MGNQFFRTTWQNWPQQTAVRRTHSRDRMVVGFTFHYAISIYGDQLYWWKKPEYPESITDHGQVTD